MTLEVSRPQRIQLLEADSVSSLTSGLKVRSEVVLDETVFTVARDDYRTLCERLFDAGFDFPSSLTGVDMDWGLGVVLHLQQLESKRKVTVRVYVPYEEPRVPTVSDLWGGVDWHEREAYDLVGIHFDGHHDHRRILLEDHWTIHPLQRKYNTRGYVIPTWTAKPWPTPAPWEEGFTPFGAAAAPAAHAPKPAAPAATASSPAPAATSSEPAAPSTPSSEPATPAASSTVPAVEAPKKAAKKWVPKTSVADTSSAEPAAAPPAPVEAPVVVPETPKVETAPAPQPEVAPSSEPEAPEEKPRSPKIKRWEPKS